MESTQSLPVPAAVKPKFWNMSFTTTFLAVMITLIGYASPYHGELIISIGFFALSGAITNWLAVHMLFERVPFLYGSGVIPARFTEFKGSIRGLVMSQFFSRDSVNRFLVHSGDFDLEALADSLDYGKVFEKLVEAVMQSKLGGMLALIGGAEALKAVQQPFELKMREAVGSMLRDDLVKEKVKAYISDNSDHLIKKVENLVMARLNELTPDMVKEIVQDMIRQHLGWLVVWGGVFGGLLGALAYFIRSI